MKVDGCLFCGMVAGTVPIHKVWESDDHLAFLTIFPNTEGVTVVIPKEHYPSDAFALPDEILSELVLASKKVAQLLGKAFDDVGRTALVFEGFGVDHVHAKLFPMHGTKMPEWKPIESKVHTYFDTYAGYISSHDYDRADEETLAKLAARLRNLDSAD